MTVCATEGAICKCEGGSVTFGSSDRNFLGKIGTKTSRPVKITEESIECSRGKFRPLNFQLDGGVQVCACHSGYRQIRHFNEEKNLLLVDALGFDEKRLKIVEANIFMHFSDSRWDCIIGVYAPEKELPSARLAKLSSV